MLSRCPLDTHDDDGSGTASSEANLTKLISSIIEVNASAFGANQLTNPTAVLVSCSRTHHHRLTGPHTSPNRPSHAGTHLTERTQRNDDVTRVNGPGRGCFRVCKREN